MDNDTNTHIRLVRDRHNMPILVNLPKPEHKTNWAGLILVACMIGSAVYTAYIIYLICTMP